MFKVLLVDDEYLVRRALQIVIDEMEEFEIVGAAENAKEAMGLYESLKPDYVLMDIMIPGFNGLQVSQWIKNKNKHTTIIILTAYSNFEFAQQAIQIGVNDYLLKPYSPEKIKEVMLKYRENHIKGFSLATGLIKSISARDFQKTMKEIPLVIETIFKNKGNTREIYDALKQLLCEVLDEMHCMDKGYRTFYENKFMIAEGTCKDQSLAEFWLFDLVDEVYRQKIIQNYPQFIRVFSYIEENMKQEISLQQASNQAILSSSYLSRLFKKELGINFVSYINLKKVRAGKKYLKFSDMTINDVAFELGYNESSYFCKVFKGIEGITPTQYREGLKEGHP
ncbi:response regulator [Alkaliphilus crotonatoxidans]